MQFRPAPLCSRFFREECGQDLIEYAILTAIVTVGGIVIFGQIRDKIGPAYFTWQSTGQDNWTPNVPIVTP